MTEESPLASLQKQIRERLREGIAKVQKIEDASTQQDLDKWIAGEIKRYGGRPLEIEDE